MPYFNSKNLHLSDVCMTRTWMRNFTLNLFSLLLSSSTIDKKLENFEFIFEFKIAINFEFNFEIFVIFEFIFDFFLSISSFFVCGR